MSCGPGWASGWQKQGSLREQLTSSVGSLWEARTERLENGPVPEVDRGFPPERAALKNLPSLCANVRKWLTILSPRSPEWSPPDWMICWLCAEPALWPLTPRSEGNPLNESSQMCKVIHTRIYECFYNMKKGCEPFVFSNSIYTNVTLDLMWHR